jgi:hypothetical protein
MDVKAGDVVKIADDSMWDRCLLEVEEVRTWGVVGAVVGYNGTYPLRVATKDICAIYRKVEEPKT